MTVLANVPASSLSFPTGYDTRSKSGRGRADRRLGSPVPAAPCRCQHGVLNEDTCIFCGRFPADTIRATWRLRALVIAARGR